MDACNFPEILALDLESAESIFASKRMSAGLPRISVIHESPEDFQHQNLYSPGLLEQLKEAVACSPTSDLVPPKTCAQNTFETTTAAMPATEQEPRCSTLPATVGSAQSDSETDSIDSFVAATARRTLVASHRAAPPPLKPLGHQQHQHQLMRAPEELPALLQKINRYTKPFDPSDNDIRSNTVHGHLRNGSGRISYNNRDSYASYEGYGSLFGDYEDADDNDDYTLPSDAESVSSFSVSVPTSNRDRQHSFATAATSVTSSDHRISTQSHTLSAMGPLSPVCEPRHSRMSSESAQSSSRRAGANRDSDTIDDHNTDSNDSPAPAHSKTSTRNSTRKSTVHQRRDRHPEDSLAVMAFAHGDMNRQEPRSWLRIGDDGSDDDDDDDSENCPASFKANTFAFTAMPIDQRPSSSHQRFGNANQDGPVGGALSQGAHTIRAVPRRRSSLNHSVDSEPLGSSDQQRRRLKHFVSLHELSSLRDAACAAAPSWIARDNGSTYADSRAVSPTSHVRCKTISSAGEAANERPLVLQQTVYRRPNAAPSLSEQGLQSYSDNTGDEYDDHDNGEGGNGLVRRDTVTSIITSRFDDFDDTYDYDRGDRGSKIMSATAVPFSKPIAGSVRSVHSVRSRHSMSPKSKTAPKFHSAAATPHEADLQRWARRASQERRQPLPVLTPVNGRPSSWRLSEPVYGLPFGQNVGPAGWVPAEQDQALEQIQEDAVPIPPQQAQPYDYSSFYRPGIVGIPLPREVVETLRVSVSCFPETMLSLSSFSVQTIRTYSRKLRRSNPSDSDSTLRLLMAPDSFPPPSPAAPWAPEVSLMRTGTDMSSTTTTSRRFWNRLGGLRSSPSYSSLNLNGASNTYSLSSTRPSTPRQWSGRGTDDGKVPSQSGSGVCFKRIFPKGSDYLCDALYAHIITFNYISLLCPPPDDRPASSEPASMPPSETGMRPQTSAGDTIATTSTGTLMVNGEEVKRQTIHIYMGSDVALDNPSTDSPSEPTEPDCFLSSMPAKFLEEYSTAADGSDTSSPPPSRGRADDSNRMVSRKAASLLGMTPLLEPDMSSSHASKRPSGSGLSRRLWRRNQSSSSATAKKPVAASKITKPHPTRTPQVSKAVDTASQPFSQAPSRTSASSDGQLRDLQAGLHNCISQLVSTLKATTDPLGSVTTVLTTTETARELDPVFLRMLSELVRSQEEP